MFFICETHFAEGLSLLPLIRRMKPFRVTDVSELGKNPLAINRLQQICGSFISLEKQDVKEQNSRRESQVGREDVAREDEKSSCSILHSSCCRIPQSPQSETPRQTPQETWGEGCLWSEVEKGELQTQKSTQS